MFWYFLLPEGKKGGDELLDTTNSVYDNMEDVPDFEEEDETIEDDEEFDPEAML